MSALWAGRTAVAIGLRLLLANGAGATVIFVYLAYLSPHTHSVDERTANTINTLVFVGYFGLTIVLGGAMSLRRARHVLGWLASGRPPDDLVRYEALAQPVRQAKVAAVFWLAAAALFGGLNTALGATPMDVCRAVLGTLLGGLTSFAMTYLLVERRMRPVVAQALVGADDATTRAACSRGLGILPRLLLSWLLGSAVPLLGVGLAQVGRTAEERARLAVPTWFLVGSGLAAGLLITVVAARSVSDPLHRVRGAVEEVRRGRVDVTVAVDDGSEVGQLQSGFNAMVAGLRERQRLRELFGRYVGDAVAREALAREVGLRGEQLPASALFVDLVGSTALAERRPAEEVVAVLNALFGAVVDVVTRHGGWVNKFDGDGALAVFGPPTGLDGHAAAALRAARDLRTELARLAPAYPGLDAGIGVSSGTVVAGNVGAEDRYEYTVLGDPVNEAARLTDLAKRRPTRVLASGRAVAAADGEAPHWRAAGRVTVRGRGAETETYEPVET